jgi:hypothetical protein
MYRQSLNRHPGKLFVAVLGVLFIAPTSNAASSQQVNAAIQKAVAYLYSTQQDGNWDGPAPDFGTLQINGWYSHAASYGGYTAIATYALLAAGESPQKNPNLAAAIKWLMNADLHGTYAVALRSQVWLLSASSKERNAARDADARFLLDSIVESGPKAGFYGYSYGVPGQVRPDRATRFGNGGPAPDWWIDRSNSQYGVLGVWALEQAGAEIPQLYWELVDKAWKDAQQPDGGWNYNETNPEDSQVTPTMTAAGLATLFITQDYLQRGKRWDPCTGGTTNQNIENGLVWMDKHIQEALASGNYYGMYGIERIGAASGRKYFGSLDWYQVGADYLVHHQSPDGSWQSMYRPVADTCFGLLFLARGRAPVMLNKLQYTTTEKTEPAQLDAWNERPRDAANAVKWAGSQVEGFFNWQIVNLNVAADELHDAPILFISGSRALRLSQEEMDKLRLFVQQGGMILGNADCGSLAFSRSFEALGTALFGYEFRQLPLTHVIYAGEQFPSRHWLIHPKLRAMSNGVRELMVLMATGDPGRVWQTDSSKLRPEMFELAADIFQYAADRQNLYFKGDTYIVKPDASQPTNTLSIARIQTDGNWDPEPGGWTRLAGILHNDRALQLNVEPVKLGAGKLLGYKIAHLTGTSRIVFNDSQRQELRTFVTSGGTLIVDAAGGDPVFAESCEAELKRIFGPDVAASLATPLAMDAPVFSTGNKIDSIAYRSYAARALGGGLRKARLCGIPVEGGRIGVFYSREDISGGLVGEPVDGIVGYDPATSTQLMTNMILYAQKNAPAAAPGPP